MSKILLNELLHRLEDVQGGKDSYIARCPVCGGEKPSLKIDEADGRILLHCFAGCGTREICAALGIKPEELSDGAHKSGGKDEIQEIRALFAALSDEIQEIRALLAALSEDVKTLRRLIAAEARQNDEEQANHPLDKTPTPDRP